MKLLSALISTLFIANLKIHFVKPQIVTSPLFGTLIGTTAQSAWTSKTIYQFLSVKYAEAPSGPMRFKKPVLAIPNPGIHKADSYLLPCPFLDYIKIKTPEQLSVDLEDCLHLNIYTTNFTAQNAVMVFIHGGRFENMSPKTFLPNYLSERDVILVTIKYRLGALAFLSTESDEIPGNLGLNDVLTALEWIKICIHHFGGDPSRVTIFGHSSGAAMVSALVFNPAVSDDLFHRAIIMSGSSIADWSFDSHPLVQSRNIAAQTNCNQTETVAGLNECYLHIPVIPLMEAYTDNINNVIEKCNTPCGGSKFVINDIFPLHPSKVLKSEKSFKDIPLMIGVSRHDAVSYIGTEIYGRLTRNKFGIANQTFNTHELIDFFINYMGVNDYTGTLKGLMSTMFDQQQLNEGNYYKMLPSIIDMGNIMFMKAPIFKSARAQVNLYPNHTFLYTMDYRGEFSYADVYNFSNPIFRQFVQHGDELIYTLAHPPYAQNLNKEDDRKFAEKFVDLFTSFAKTGIPESAETPIWPPMTDFAGPYLHFDKEFWVGENFLDEFSVVSRDFHCKNGVTMVKVSYCILFYITFMFLLNY